MTEAVEAEPIVKELRIEAAPQTVFSFFTDPEKLTRWLCDEAICDPRAGGALRQVHPGRDGNAYRMSGEFVEVSPPDRVVFTWGWENESMATRPGSTTVEVTLKARGTGTLLRLVHSGLAGSEAAEHDAGWDEMLKRLDRAVSGDQPSGVARG